MGVTFTVGIRQRKIQKKIKERAFHVYLYIYKRKIERGDKKIK